MQLLGGRRAGAIESAAKVWTGQLVDLTARNNLLFYRDLKVGTLDLDGVAPDLLTSLLAGRTIAVSRMFPDPDARSDAGQVRGRAVHNRAREHFEERGLETLVPGLRDGHLEQHARDLEAAAPVLLAAGGGCAPLGAAQEEFELALTDEMEVNPTLFHLLRADFDCA